MSGLLTVKKYRNRRLYDMERRTYISMTELIESIQAGRHVRVLDAQTEEDITQATLVHLMVKDGRADRLPVAVLMQLVGMQDGALDEFYSLYLTWALDVYFAMKQRDFGRTSPFFAATELLAGPPRAPHAVTRARQSGKARAQLDDAAVSLPASELSALRRELNALKRQLNAKPTTLAQGKRR